MDEKKGWIISIIACDDGNYTEEYIHLKNSILTLKKKNEAIEYIIYYFNIETGIASIIKSDYSSGTLKLEIAKEEPADIYNLSTLRNFFKNYVIHEGWDQKRQMVITWGHGAGIGFFGNFDDLSKSLEHLSFNEAERSFLRTLNEANKELINIQANLSIKVEQKDAALFLEENYIRPNEHNFASAGFKETVLKAFTKKAKFITAVEFAAIIKETIGKTNVLICTNCYMQMFETGFALKDCVDLMIAAQTTIPFDGINYNKLFELIHNDPLADFDDIGKNSIDFFKLKYLEEPYKTYWLKRYKNFDFDQVSVSANLTEYYIKIAKCVKEFVSECIKVFKEENVKIFKEENVEELKVILRFARQKCLPVTLNADTNVIDLTLFFNSILKNPDISSDKYKFVIEKIENYFFYKEKCCFSIYSPVKLSTLSENLFAERSPKGLSIYFPLTTNYDMSKFIKRYYKRTKNPSNFIKNTNWDLFLQKIKE